jgi:hypothetical protein
MFVEKVPRSEESTYASHGEKCHSASALRSTPRIGPRCPSPESATNG